MGIVHINSLSEVAGRLQYHIANWKLVTKDQWVWNAVEGYRIDLISEIKMPSPHTFNQDHFALIQQEVKELINKAEVSEVLNTQTQMVFYSNLFLVLKKTGASDQSGRCLKEELITARDLSRLLDKMNAGTQVIPPAPLFYRHLQISLSQALDFSFQNYETNIILSQDCKEELSWWIANMRKWNGKTLFKKEINLTIKSDASLTGWGAVCSHQRTRGSWS